MRSGSTPAGISQALFDELKWYFQYALSTGANVCASPNGNVLVKTINHAPTDTQGFIARDDEKKEIIVAFRGTTSLTDAFVDILIVPVPLLSPGVHPPLGSLVHVGFLTAYNSVASDVISTVRNQLQLYPDYNLVASGHSLGGAIASIAGLSLQQNFPHRNTRMYTYGQPRTFNGVAAHFVNSVFGNKAHRCT
ncbi:hypothetical protein HGRIS_011003 [Hohenbuehelia grisea]|uniref:Fungal lipase-type domain-containing protein n=1 Tax=Hohenbuehelia grisea TaxID=104357 RepID=A0ABR3IYI1_9AGAR